MKSDLLSLMRSDTGTLLVEQLQPATNIWSRFVGLQFRRSLPKTHGVLFVPCSSIHTMFVRFAIDVYFLTKDGVVAESRRNVQPWKFVLPKHSAHAVLETINGAIDLEVGTRLQLNSETGRFPKPLQFLAGNAEQLETQL